MFLFILFCDDLGAGICRLNVDWTFWAIRKLQDEGKYFSQAVVFPPSSYAHRQTTAKAKAGLFLSHKNWRPQPLVMWMTFFPLRFFLYFAWENDCLWWNMYVRYVCVKLCGGLNTAANWGRPPPPPEHARTQGRGGGLWRAAAVTRRRAMTQIVSAPPSHAATHCKNIKVN